jgi:hypothetical protein
LFLCVPWRTPHSNVRLHSVDGPGTIYVRNKNKIDALGGNAAAREWFGLVWIGLVQRRTGCYWPAAVLRTCETPGRYYCYDVLAVYVSKEHPQMNVMQCGPACRTYWPGPKVDDDMANRTVRACYRCSLRLRFGTPEQ